MKRRLTLADVHGDSVTRQEAAEILGRGVWAVYMAIKRGEIPTVPGGRRMLVPTAWLETALGRSTSDKAPARRRHAAAR